jgi:hypothetical protein
MQVSQLREIAKKLVGIETFEYKLKKLGNNIAYPRTYTIFSLTVLKALICIANKLIRYKVTHEAIGSQTKVNPVR